jgi:hypothetical protein
VVESDKRALDWGAEGKEGLWCGDNSIAVVTREMAKLS